MIATGEYRDLLTSHRWQKLAAAGAGPQRLLWASIGTKDPDALDTFYIEALASANHQHHYGLHRPQRATY